MTEVPAHDGRLAFGGGDNPEQWPRAVWAEDLGPMREAGVPTLVDEALVVPAGEAAVIRERA